VTPARGARTPVLSPSGVRHLKAAAAGATIGAGVGALVFDPAREPGQVMASAVLCAAMAAIALEDSLRFRVPDPWVYGALAAGLVWSIAERLEAGEGIATAAGTVVIAAAVCGGAFWAVREGFFRLRGIDGLGLGDVKLAAAGGAWLGWDLFAAAVFVAAVGAIAFVAAAMLRQGNWMPGRRLAFGAFLAPAIWAVWLVARYGPQA